MLFYGIQLYCILWHHAQLIVWNCILYNSIVNDSLPCNLILYYSIVIIVSFVQFNFRLSYCVG
nr:MAG TPA: hypothetical protein [Caudoviricetes sp.]